MHDNNIFIPWLNFISFEGGPNLMKKKKQLDVREDLKIKKQFIAVENLKTLPFDF